MVVCLCLSACGPAMNWRLVQCVALPSPCDSETYDRLQQSHTNPEFRKQWLLKVGGWMDGWLASLFRQRVQKKYFALRGVTKGTDASLIPLRG